MNNDTSDTDPLSQALKSFFDKDTYEVNIIKMCIIRILESLILPLVDHCMCDQEGHHEPSWSVVWESVT